MNTSEIIKSIEVKKNEIEGRKKEVDSEVNQLVKYLASITNCFVNEKTKEIIKPEEGSGLNLTDFVYHNRIPDFMFEHFFNKSLNNDDLKGVYLDNMENDDFFDTPNFKASSNHNLTKPILELIEVDKEKRHITLKILDFDSSNYCWRDEDYLNQIIYLDYYGSNLFFDLMFKHELKIGSIVKPELISMQEMITTKYLTGFPTVYKFEGFKSKKIWMEKPGRKALN